MRNLGKFFDNKHFARGFSRSGEFTINEAQILENYGRTMQGLFEGKLIPEDDDEHAFIAAFQQEEGSADKYAQCWKKYLSKTQRKRTYTLCSTVKSGASSSYDDDSDSDDLLLDD